MSEFSEMPIQQMHLKEKQQLEYAKFAISIDEIEDEWFVKSGIERDTLKDIFFEVFNSNSNKDFAWILDLVFDVITQKMSYTEKKQSFQYLAALRVHLAGQSSDGFNSSATKDLFVGKTTPSSKKSIMADPAASGDTGNILIKDKEIHPLDYIDSPAEAWAKAKEPTKDESIN